MGKMELKEKVVLILVVYFIALSLLVPIARFAGEVSSHRYMHEHYPNVHHYNYHHNKPTPTGYYCTTEEYDKLIGGSRCGYVEDYQDRYGGLLKIKGEWSNIAWLKKQS